jgi:transcriptional regulator with XRE-family HTH domain
MFITNKILVIYKKILLSRKMITAGQIRAARGMLNISQLELANDSNLNTATISRIEKDEESLETAGIATIKKIKLALEKRGIVFATPREEENILTIGIKQIIKLNKVS